LLPQELLRLRLGPLLPLLHPAAYHYLLPPLHLLLHP